MVAGIPGTSISGLYYILLALMMPVREFYVTCQGQSSVRRWLHIALQLVNSLGIVASIWATGWLLSLTIRKTMFAANMGAAFHLPGQIGCMVTLAGAFCALVILAFVLVGVLGLSLILPKRPVHATLPDIG